MIRTFLISLLLLQTVTSDDSKGTIGWKTYNSLGLLQELHTGVQTRQFSSFDRKGGNDDGGPYACLKMTKENHCVIAEWSGPGELVSIWSTRDNGVVSKTGRIVIELDGETVVSHMFEDIVRGRVSLPFLWPLVGSGDDTEGGVVIEVPMTFKHSMRITTDTNPNYYHVTFRTFSDDNGVSTFDPTVAALDVLEINRHYGVDDPKHHHKEIQTKKYTISTNQKIHFNDSGEIRQIRVHIPNLVRSPQVIDDGRAFGKDGYSMFIVKVHPENKGVRITRRLDPSIGQQVARMSVNGAEVAKWNSHSAVKVGSWSEETIQVPANLTKNFDHINVRNDFVSSVLDFNEFRYDVDSLVNDEWLRTDVLDVGPGHPGEEVAHHYENWKQTWAANRVFRYPVDSKVFKTSSELLESTHIQITFDNQKTVDAPIGEFFGSGLGMYDVRSLMMSIDARTSWFTTWWPMPFGTKAEIEFVNSQKNISNITVEVSVLKNSSFKEELHSGKIGYFHATHNKGQTVNGQDFVFLKASGHGVFLGVSHTMHGLIAKDNLRNYLEGDERVYVDGRLTPQIYGTGTEDFYESGWYFRGNTYDMPLAGNPSHQTAGDGCQYDCTGALRLFIPGAIHFLSSIAFSIEHGPVNNEPAIYSSVAYWYGQKNPILKVSDTVEVTDKKSRTAHQYSASGETTYQLTSVFEGINDKVNVLGNVTKCTGTISFTVNIDPKNRGVRIFRTGDQQVSYQNAEVFVDGKLVGKWLEPLGNTWQRWLNDDYDIPPSATKGRSKLSISLVPKSHDGGPVLWTASRYQALSIMPNV